MNHEEFDRAAPSTTNSAFKMSRSTISRLMRPARYAFALVAVAALAASRQQPPQPVFDVHLHTPTNAAGEVAMRAMMDSLNVTHAVMMGTPSEVARQATDTSRFLRSLFFPCPGGRLPNAGTPCFPDGREFPDTAWLRAAIRSREIQVLGEIATQYMGLPPNDPRMLPYYKLAEELDIPVGVHLGIGPPGVAYPNNIRRSSPNYSGFAGDPRLLEPVLTAYPKLRLYVMHGSWPYLEGLLYMMYMHPQLYADISVLQYAIPHAAYMSHLRALVDAGFADRLMFGSDGGAKFLKQGVEAIRDADFLTEKQKRDILHDNAMRFFRLGPAAGKSK